MADKQVAGFGIPAGQLTQRTLPIGTLTGNIPLELPVWIFRGKEDGPGLLLTAGIHGDETNGTEIVRQLISEQVLLPQRGMVIAVPVVNIPGFMFHSRMFDHKDLNRSFPGSSHGSLVARMAYVLMQQILPHIDIGIDFHTGSGQIENYPYLCGLFTQAYTKELAQAFRAPFVVPVEPIEHSFRKEAQKVGKPIFTYEGGEAMRLNSYAIEQGKAGVLRLMQHLRMRDFTFQDMPASVWLRNAIWVRTHEAGIFQPFVACGAKVRKNERVGLISDVFSSSQTTIRSPHEGYILSMQRAAVVNSGDVLFQLGK